MSEGHISDFYRQFEWDPAEPVFKMERKSRCDGSQIFLQKSHNYAMNHYNTST